MNNHLRFNDESMDSFEPSDSDSDYDENEKQLLAKVRSKRKQYSDSEDEVLGVVAASDVEDQEDDLPNVRAWGTDKKTYYSTDYVDADYGGFEGKDAHLAELEEEEARNIQKQLAQQLDDDDFALDISYKVPEEDTHQIEQKIKTDISKLTKRQKLDILRKDSPEFFGLIEDFERKLTDAKDYLHPVLQKYKKGEIPTSPAIEFVQTKYELILNYCTNIYMYIFLKSSKSNVQHHPVIKRLYQYRQLLSQLEPVYEEAVKPQIEVLLQESVENSEDKPKEQKKSKKKKLNILTKLIQKVDEPSNKKKSVTFEDIEPKSKKIKLSESVLEEKEEEEVAEDDVNELDEDNIEEGGDLDKRRAISYKMAKNKGLTPHRKKEQRNPRVKHKERYRKALIRRKGAVREARKPLTKYGGEVSGIKSVVKSIKIKT